MRVVRFLIAVLGFLMLPMGAAAQISTAGVTGTVVDESKAVLPGVSIVATDLETGRTYETVSDTRGVYQLPPLPPGAYKIEADVAGFARTEIPKIELLVGQNASLNLTMRISSVEESLTVRSEAPLVDLNSTQVAGNIDRRQMEAMPLQGRNWLELSLLIKGVTTNNVTNSPGVGGNESFNLNLDGQQIKQNVLSSGSGEPRFSREAIAEFQIVTSNFDITQGRSTGVQVQAISKSGTNSLSGAVYGYFRDDSLNAPDPVAHVVLPYSNQQTGFALGGPVVKDRLHYFFTYEHENNPATVFTQPPQLGGIGYTRVEPDEAEQLARARRLADLPAHAACRSADRTGRRRTRSRWAARPIRRSPASRSRTPANLAATLSRVYSNTRVGPAADRLQPVPHFDAAAAQRLRPAAVRLPGRHDGRAVQLSEHRRHAHVPVPLQRELDARQARLQVRRRVHQGRATPGIAYYSAFGRMTFLSLPSAAEMTRRFPIDQWNNPAAWDLTGLDAIVQRFDLNADAGSGGVPPWNYDVPAADVRGRGSATSGTQFEADDQLRPALGRRLGRRGASRRRRAVDPDRQRLRERRLRVRAGHLRSQNFAPRGGFTYNVGASTTS